MKIDLKILNDKVTPEMLKPKTPGSAGIDLMAVDYLESDAELDNLIIYPGNCIKIGSGVAVHISDPNYAAVIVPRSGLGHNGLVLGNLVGLIDSDYQGEIIMSVWNRSQDIITISSMDRIAQLVIVPIVRPEFNIVDSFEQSERGSSGFGSTGIAADVAEISDTAPGLAEAVLAARRIHKED